MPIRLIQIPYDSAHRDQRMGAGPAQIAAGWEDRALALPARRGGGRQEPIVVESTAGWLAEIGTAFELNRILAPVVRTAVLDGDLPVVLAGNCNTALGAVAGVAAALEGNERADRSSEQEGVADPGIGVIWLDSHADFNTPETTTTGFLDGMALAALTGYCWRTMAHTIPGFRAIPSGRVALIGGSQLDATEGKALAGAGVMHVPAGQVSARDLPSAIETVLDSFEARRVARVYLHIDLDVHDPASARANEFTLLDGYSPEAVRDVVRRVAARLPIAAAALTAYDPAYDTRHRTLRVALNLLDTLAAAAELRPSAEASLAQ